MIVLPIQCSRPPTLCLESIVVYIFIMITPKFVSNLEKDNGHLSMELLHLFFAKIRNYSMLFWAFIANSGSLKRIDYPKQICLTHPLSYECFA